MSGQMEQHRQRHGGMKVHEVCWTEGGAQVVAGGFVGGCREVKGLEGLE